MSSFYKELQTLSHGFKSQSNFVCEILNNAATATSSIWTQNLTRTNGRMRKTPWSCSCTISMAASGPSFPRWWTAGPITLSKIALMVLSKSNCTTKRSFTLVMHCAWRWITRKSWLSTPHRSKLRTVILRNWGKNASKSSSKSVKVRNKSKWNKRVAAVIRKFPEFRIKQPTAHLTIPTQIERQYLSSISWTTVIPSRRWLHTHPLQTLAPSRLLMLKNANRSRGNPNFRVSHNPVQFHCRKSRAPNYQSCIKITLGLRWRRIWQPVRLELDLLRTIANANTRRHSWNKTPPFARLAGKYSYAQSTTARWRSIAFQTSRSCYKTKIRLLSALKPQAEKNF